MVSEQPLILIADSDEQRQGVLRALCKRKGWDCHIAEDAVEFQGIVDAGECDLVIADLTALNLELGFLLGSPVRRRLAHTLVVVGDTEETSASLPLLQGSGADIMVHPINWKWVERCMDQVATARRMEMREQKAYSFVVSERTELQFSCKQLGEAQAISLPIVARLMASRRLSDPDALKIRLAVQEALLNAFEHGNLELDSRWKEEVVGGVDRFSLMRRERLKDPEFANRMVYVTSWFDGEAIEITVKDEGRGFSSSEIEDSKRDKLSCFGRGLTLMRNAVDEVRFSCGGSEVALIKRLDTARST